jgi:hypothetical protein
MRDTFELFRDLFENRYQKISVLDLGEDSVRYDFFIACMETLKLKPWEIQLEHAVPPNSFKPRENVKRKRDEKPQIDLWIDAGKNKIGFEFAFFKRNKVDGSRINYTEYIFKVLNDMMRLTLNAELTQSKAYFVCVADQTMLGRQLWDKQLPMFPAEQYIFDANKPVQLCAGLISAKNRLDERFIYKLKEMKMRVTSNLIYNETIHSKLNPYETRALVWDIKWQIN